MPRTPQPHDPNAPAHDLATQRCTHARPRPRLPLCLSPLPLLGTPQHTRTLLRSRRVRSTPYRRNAKPSSRYRSDRPYTQRLRESTRPCCRIFLFLATKPRSGTKAILLRSKRSLAHGKSPGRQIRQSRYASKTSPLRARTRFRGQKVGPSLSNQDCYRPDRPRRARTAQTPLKPPLRQAGPFGAPDRRGPARN